MIFVFFIYGLLIGSFMNVCIYRIPREESISYPPSHCTSCNTRLRWVDLIPVVSYIYLRGRCKYCSEKISIKYPLFELLTGVFFALVYKKFGLTVDTFKYIIFGCHLIVIGLIDLFTMDVYFSTIVSGVLFGVVFIILNLINGGGFITYLLGALVGSGFILLVILLTRGGMGYGDAEICLICGLYLGLPKMLLALFIAINIGGLVGAIILAANKKSRKDPIPFGPFIAIGGILASLFGDSMINWYLNLLR